MRNKKAKVTDPNEFVCNPGEQFKTEYSAKVMPDGTITLEPSGRIDIQEMINSYKDQTDMAYILKQIELGNTDVLQQRQGIYDDITKFPKTYAEMLQLRIDSEKAFYDLSPEIRQQFNNDFNQFFATVGQNEWFEKLGYGQTEEDIKNSEEGEKVNES